MPWRRPCCTPRDRGELLDTLDGDEEDGCLIVHRALEEPMCIQIAVNQADGSIVARGSETGTTTPPTLTGEYEDMVSAGITDPPWSRGARPERGSSAPSSPQKS